MPRIHEQFHFHLHVQVMLMNFGIKLQQLGLVVNLRELDLNFSSIQNFSWADTSAAVWCGSVI